MACTATRAAVRVVIIGIRLRTAMARIRPSSVSPPLRVGVLMINWISPLANLSRMFGRAPSEIFRMSVVSTLWLRSSSRVPSVV